MKVNKKIIKLFTNRGFYILLALAAVLAGVSGYVKNLRSKTAVDTPISAVISEPTPLQSSDQKVSYSPALGSDDTNNRQSAMQVASAVSSSEENWQIQFILPLQGELGMNFSGDELVFSRTMLDWRIHPGLDIRADVGTPVKAAADGVVTKVYNDDMMGFTVIILHPDGFETIYSNLQTGQLVEENQEVKLGDVIGGVGMTAACEINEPPHLHFEIKKDGMNVNPFDYLS